MNETNFGIKIRHALNQGARPAAHIADRLRMARESALAARKVEREHLVNLADNVLGRVGGFGGLSLRVLLPLAVAIVGLAGIYSWQLEQRAADVEEIDTLLLTDDLPIDAYLDRGFDAWLKKRSAN